jgi:CheY-like chemotaxis protein
LTVRFNIPGAAEPIETQARVMWVRRATSEEGMPPGVGLQFDQLEEHVGRIIDSVVQGFSGVKLMALADDPAALARLSRYLQSILTCEVVQASAAETLATGFSQPVDLALLDLDSAGDSGLMLVQMASESAAQPVPIIVLTSKPVMKAMAMKEGAAMVIANPPTYDALRQCVLGVLGKPHQLG